MMLTPLEHWSRKVAGLEAELANLEAGAPEPETSHMRERWEEGKRYRMARRDDEEADRNDRHKTSFHARIHGQF